MSTLPNVPEGENPYTAYLQTVDTFAYNHPTSGFSARLFVLMGLIAVAIVANFAILGLVWLDQRRRGAPFWVFRKVKREGGAHLTTNVKIIMPSAAILILFAILGYVVDAYQAFILHGSMGRLGGWRAGLTLPMIWGGWLVTFGGLQAYLLTNTHKTRILTPRVVNILFFGVGGLLCCGHIAAVTIASVAYNEAFAELVQVVALMKEREKTWTTDESTTAVLFSLAPQLLVLLKKYHKLEATTSGMFYYVGALALFLFLINIGSLSLLFTVRKQIQAKMGAFGEQGKYNNAAGEEGLEGVPAAAGGASTSGAGRGSGSGTGSGSGHHRSGEGSGHGSGSGPSRAQIRRMARGEMQTAVTEHARQIASLQRAERDLMVVAFSIMALSSGGTALCFLVAVLIRQDKFFTLPWPVLEFVYFSTYWGFIGIIYVFSGVLLHNTIINLAPKSGQAGSELTTGAGQYHPEMMQSVMLSGGGRSRRGLCSTQGVTVTVDCAISVDFGMAANGDSEVVEGKEKEKLGGLQEVEEDL
ncbi:hypothetical protein T439DRAFT_326774 [Meredithblackwellia eburnea MCA 4105]